MKKRIFFVVSLVFLIITIAATVYLISIPKGEQDIRRSASPSSTTLRVASYNIMYPAQTNNRLDRLAEYVSEKKIDVIAIQETYGYFDDGPKWKPSWKGRDSTLEYLRERLRVYGWPMYQTPGWGKAHKDTSFLSRYTFNAKNSDEYKEIKGINTKIKMIKIRVDKKPVRIYSIHPVGHLEDRRRTLNRAINDAKSHKEEYFILGDYNIDLHSPIYKEMSDEHKSACDPVKKKSMCTDSVNDNVWNRYNQFDDQIPAIGTIDHVFMKKNSNWTVKNAYIDKNAGDDYVWPTPGKPKGISDHYPVIVNFEYGKVCVPNCNNKKCGESDSCGGKCSGSCPSGRVCRNYKCIKKDNPKPKPKPKPPQSNKADLNNDGRVDIRDLSIILNNWRWKNGQGNDAQKADVNDDGKIDLLDVAVVLGEWG